MKNLVIKIPRKIKHKQIFIYLMKELQMNNLKLNQKIIYLNYKIDNNNYLHQYKKMKKKFIKKKKSI